MRPQTLEQYINSRHTDQTAKTYLYYIGVFIMKYPNASILTYSDIIQYINSIKQITSEVSKISPHFSAVKRYYDYLLETGQRHPSRSDIRSAYRLVFFIFVHHTCL